jgi:choice-of-anchor B domain-containing protein
VRGTRVSGWRRWGLRCVALVVLLGMGWGLLMPAGVAAHPGELPGDDPLPATSGGEPPASRADYHRPEPLEAVSDAACVDGLAGGYPCYNVDLLSFLPLSDIGGTQSDASANDIWGWTDPQTGMEVAIVGRRHGTSFVDISDPRHPVYLGELPAHGGADAFWRDIKVYANHAFIVSEARGHGMQVFDLTQLREMTHSPVTLRETAFYARVSSAHNLAINEGTGYAYITGAGGTNSCDDGLHMVDIRQPTAPTFAGCFDADGYTHDAQCVLYTGPDEDYQGQEVCLNSNEDTLTIVDVTDKTSPQQISRTGYPGSAYSHQGWLTEDQRYFLMDDELDEQAYGHNTRTRIWDQSDLDRPVVLGFFENSTPAMDHNLYVRDGFAYQANYRAGLRVLDIRRVAEGDLRQVGFFDIYPADDAPEISGAWSTYPFFASGVVIVSGIEQGLFVLQPHLRDPGPEPAPPATPTPDHGHSVSGGAATRLPFPHLPLFPWRILRSWPLPWLLW